MSHWLLMPDEKARYEHPPCASCVYKGAFYRRSGGNFAYVGDAYVCKSTVIIREGDDPGNYGSEDVRNLRPDSFNLEFRNFSLRALTIYLWEDGVFCVDTRRPLE